MKRKALAYAITTSLVSLVVIAGTSSPNSHIDEVVRVPIHVIEHDGIESKRDNITVVIREIGDHDDSVGTRDKTGGIDTYFVAAPDPNDSPNTELPPVNCSHPSYASLCDDLKDSIEGGDGGEGGPPTNVWVSVYAGSKSMSASYKLAATPKRIRFNSRGDGEAWFGTHINRVDIAYAGGGARDNCSGKRYTTQCTWSFNTTSAKGCSKSVSGYDGYRIFGANGSSCTERKVTNTAGMTFSRIEVMY
ncbi:hypothetical protein PVK62_08410 [Aliivibrio sp. S3MY1]|uniref:hypothetical protein n=1 Tax=Aliivibrio sp. S3MY1 TaxID=3028424 RepID=UPI002379578F|nr:hypothetical protein [Aliivibrio sp. S3MY1]MDD9195862.1 hypothetical protein [Aliivibrio sp. S3MY1]